MTIKYVAVLGSLITEVERSYRNDNRTSEKWVVVGERQGISRIPGRRMDSRRCQNSEIRDFGSWPVLKKLSRTLQARIELSAA